MTSDSSTSQNNRVICSFYFSRDIAIIANVCKEENRIDTFREEEIPLVLYVKAYITHDEVESVFSSSLILFPLTSVVIIAFLSFPLRRSSSGTST